MAATHNLTMATFNLHGPNQGISYLTLVCNEYDIAFVQEHWLATFDLNRMDTVSDNMICYASSALDESVYLYIQIHLMLSLHNKSYCH